MDAAAVSASYRQAMMAGQRAVVRLRRYVKDDEGVFVPVTSSPLSAVLTGYAGAQVAGLIDQGASQAILLAEDVAALTKEPAPPGDDEVPPASPPPPEAWFSEAIRKADKLVLANGDELAIEDVDTRTRRLGDQLIAWQLTVAG